MYHVFVHSLAERVLAHVRREESLHAGDRVGVAVSGGIDSVALLRLLIELRHELGIVLSVVHFNHKLRGVESEADQDFVAKLARSHNLEFYCECGNTTQLASEERKGIEGAARELRYELFWKLLSGASEFTSAAEAAADSESDRSAEARPSSSRMRLDKVVTGHTLDDQAETVLMRLIRGTGLRGLGGIYPRIVVEDDDDEARGDIVRPLLGVRRSELEQYLRHLNQPWREDITNSDAKFTRNRVRKTLLPLIEREFNPAIKSSLSELAEIARDEEEYWENEISGWLGTVVQWSEPEWVRELDRSRNHEALVQIKAQGAGVQAGSDAEIAERIERSGHAIANASVSRPWLLTEPKAVQRRVIKAVGDQAGIPLEFKHVEEILQFAIEDGPGGKELSLPRGWKIVREPDAIIFVTPDLRRQELMPDYEYSLSIPGRVLVPELHLVIEAMRVAPDLHRAEYNPQQLFDASLMPEHLTVRNWRPGDRYWPAHTKSPKKIKELLQARHVSQPQRRLWPVAANGDEIVWMREFPAPGALRWRQEGDAVLIRVVPWDEYYGI